MTADEQPSWSQQKERGSLFWVRFGFGLLNLIGYLPASLLLRFVIGYFFLTGRESRRASLQYLTHLRRWGSTCGFSSLPSANWWQSFRHHLDFGFNVLDRMYFWQDRIHRYHFTWEGDRYLKAERERGALLIGAHIGSFDAARALSTERKIKVNVVMYRAHAQKLNRVLNARGPSADLNVIELDSDDIDKIFELQQRIEAGEFVAILADRIPPFGKPRTCRVPFLGGSADLPQNAWILASLLKCPVYLSAGVRTGWRRYHVMVEPMTDCVLLPRREREAAVREYVAAYAQWMESLCLKYPFQWFNFFPYWSNADEKSK